MAICTLDEVKQLTNILGTKIRYSESYKALAYDSSNGTTGRISNITFPDSFHGSYKYKIIFADSTSFILNEATIGYLGTGIANSLFTSINNSVSIDSTAWSGVFAANNKFTFESDSNISNNAAQSEIDRMSNLFYASIIPNNFIDQTAVDTYLGESTVSMSLAKSFILHKVAWKIYNDIYPEAPDLEGQTVVNHWYRTWKEAWDALTGFLTSSYTFARTPQWVAPDLQFTDKGTTGGTVFDMKTMQKNKKLW